MSKDIVATASKHRLILLSGDESALRNQALSDITTALDTSGGFDAETLLADGSRVSDWVANTQTMPFLSERRITIVRNLARVHPDDALSGTRRSASDDEDGDDAETTDSPRRGGRKKADSPLTQLLGTIPESGLLILVADDENGDRRKQERFAGHVRAWTTAVQNANGLVLEYKSDPQQTPQKLREYAQTLGKRISSSTAGTLALMVNGQLSAGMAELEKAALFVGDTEIIEDADLRAIATVEPEYKAFELADAVMRGETSNALRQLRRLLSQNTSSSTEPALALIALLATTFRNAFQARVMIEASQQRQPDPVLRSWLPARPLLDEPEWKRRRSMEAARKLTLDQLADCLNVLMDADAKLKGQRPAASPTDTLELLILELSRACTGKPTHALRLGEKYEASRNP